jgi:DNA repair ATPase RecN
MLQQFKEFNTDRASLDELVALAAFGKLLRAEYEVHNLEEPEFVDVNLKSLKREIYTRNASKLEARRKEIDARLDSLKTPSQRKAELQKEKNEIDKQLAAIA